MNGRRSKNEGRVSIHPARADDTDAVLALIEALLAAAARAAAARPKERK
jgi:hypothetical protein